MKQRVVSFLPYAALALVFGMVVFYLFRFPVPIVLAAGVGVSILAWRAVLLLSRMKMPGWFLLGLASLLSLFIPVPFNVMYLPHMAPALRKLYFLAGNTYIAILFFPVVAILVAAGLLYVALREGEGNHRERWAAGALSVLLVAKLLHNLYWLQIWDNTYDPITYFFLPLPILAALIGGFSLAYGLHGARRAGGIYALLLPALMIANTTLTHRVDFRQLTGERAGQTVAMIEAYYARQGSYPEQLSQLVPGYGLSIPGPIILYGQSWCYEGGGQSYRLGYVNREHWSDPNLYGEVYRSQGDVDSFPPVCAQELAELEQVLGAY